MATDKEKLSALAQLIKEAKEKQEELNESASHFLDIGEKALATSIDRLDLQKEEIEKKRELVAVDRHINVLAGENIELLLKNGKIKEETAAKANRDLKEKDEWLKQHAVVLKEQEKSLHTQKEIAEASAGAFDSIASKMRISQSATAAAAKNMFVMWKNAVKVEGVIKGTYKSLKAIGGSFLDIFNPINLITSGMKAIFTETWEFMMRSSVAMANFSKATGDAGEMTKDLGAAMNYAAGVDIEAVASAGAALAGSWTGMADASGAVRSSVIGMTAELERMGQSGGDTGKSLNFMTKGMGMSMPAAQDAMRGLASSAKDLGQSPAQIGSNFRAMAGTLALYGGRILDKFTDIAAMAKATGLEMADIASIGEGFDTFEGAASKVGALNALVGGPMLNSMEMLRLQSEKGPEAVTEAVIESLKAQGKSYETMGYQERKAISETLGISADKFAMMMGYQSEEMKAAAEKAKKEQKFQDRYNRMLRSTVSLAEQIKLALTAIFGNEDLQAAMKELIGEILGVGLEGKDVFKEIGIGMTAMVKEVTKFVKLLKKEEIMEKYIEPFMDWMKDPKEKPWLFGLFEAKNWQVAAAGMLLMQSGAPQAGATALARGTTGVVGSAITTKLMLRQAEKKAAKLAAKVAAEKATKAAAKKAAELAAKKAADLAAKKVVEKTVINGITSTLTKLPAAALPVAGTGATAAATVAAPIIVGAAVLGGLYMANEVLESKEEEEKTTKSVENQRRLAGQMHSDETLEEASKRMHKAHQKRLRDYAKAAKESKVTAKPTAKETALQNAALGLQIAQSITEEGKRQEGERAKEAEQSGKMMAAAFLEEMKKNAKPVEMEFKFTFDDILGVASPAHKMLYSSIENTLKKQTA